MNNLLHLLNMNTCMAHAMTSLCKKTADADIGLPFAGDSIGIMTIRALPRARFAVLNVVSSAVQTLSALSNLVCYR